MLLLKKESPINFCASCADMFIFVFAIKTSADYEFNSVHATESSANQSLFYSIHFFIEDFNCIVYLPETRKDERLSISYRFRLSLSLSLRRQYIFRDIVTLC
jgi:hypothetical protein